MMNVLQLRGFDADAIEAERRLLADTQRQRTVLLSRGPLSTAKCSALFGIAVDRLRLALALGEADEARSALADALAWACAAELGGRCAGGEITVVLAGETSHVATADGTRLTPAQWIEALWIACIAREPGARAMFADAELFMLSRIGPHADSSPMADEPFWTPYGCAFAALAAGDARAAQFAREAMALMDASSRIDPQEFAAVDRPLLECVIALAEDVRDDWNDRILQALDLFHAYYSRPDFDRLLHGYAPLGLMAVTLLARERGVAVDIDHPYMRGDWLSRPVPAIELTARVADLPARNVAEIRWWLDLAGLPRERRTHRLLERDGLMLAAHQAGYADRGPKVETTFILNEAGAPLLDAGELMQVSELYARRATDETDHAQLNEAIDALDTLLARIPPTADAVPATAFASSRGRALHSQAPGRFERARIQATRDEYERLFQPQSDPVAEARAGALVWADVIRAQLTELLERLPHEPDLVRTLQPRDEDFDKVFVPQVVERARAAYASMWQAGLEVDAPPDTSCADHIYVAPAGMLSEENELSRPFPGGYRTVAEWLDPRRVWICWRYVAPGESSGMHYDGLVWCDDHWAWFPKPYRALAQR